MPARTGRREAARCDPRGPGFRWWARFRRVLRGLPGPTGRGAVHPPRRDRGRGAGPDGALREGVDPALPRTRDDADPAREGVVHRQGAVWVTPRGSRTWWRNWRPWSPAAPTTAPATAASATSSASPSYPTEQPDRTTRHPETTRTRPDDPPSPAVQGISRCRRRCAPGRLARQHPGVVDRNPLSGRGPGGPVRWSTHRRIADDAQ